MLFTLIIHPWGNPVLPGAKSNTWVPVPEVAVSVIPYPLKIGIPKTALRNPTASGFGGADPI